MPVPITVTLTYTSGETESVVVPVTAAVVERKIPVKGTLRKVDANEDNGSLVEIEKQGHRRILAKLLRNDLRSEC